MLYDATYIKLSHGKLMAYYIFKTNAFGKKDLHECIFTTYTAAYMCQTNENLLYVCMVNTIYLLSFVETPRKFIIAELSIRKLGSSSVLIILLLALMKIRAYGSKALQ